MFVSKTAVFCHKRSSEVKSTISFKIGLEATSIAVKMPFKLHYLYSINKSKGSYVGIVIDLNIFFLQPTVQ